MKIRMVSGELRDAEYVKHLRTLANGSGRSNTEVDLYRTRDGRLVVCTQPDDARAIPEVDPSGKTESEWMFVER